MLTEVQAWRLLAERFGAAGDQETYLGHGDVVLGLCGAILIMGWNGDIACPTQLQMRARMVRNKPTVAVGFWWPPCDASGNLDRAAFASRMADLAEAES